MNASENYNVAVFIDYENVHRSLREQNKNALRVGFFEKIRLYYKKAGHRVVKIAVYCNFDNGDLYESYHQSILQSYGVETIHTSMQGKNYADLQIAIDVLNSMYLNNNIDEFVIISNDKDMIPLLNVIRANKRKATSITIGNLYNLSIIYFVDEHIPFEKIDKDIVIEDNELILKTIVYDKFLEQLYNQFLQAHKEYVLKKAEGDYKFRHYQIDYQQNIEYWSSKLKIMDYEFINTVNSMKKDGMIIFYNYSFGGKSFIAIIPTKLKELYINDGIIKEEDIDDTFDCKDIIDGLYDKWNKKPTIVN